jgi:hypothetical protein
LREMQIRVNHEIDENQEIAWIWVASMKQSWKWFIWCTKSQEMWEYFWKCDKCMKSWDRYPRFEWNASTKQSVNLVRTLWKWLWINSVRINSVNKLWKANISGNLKVWKHEMFVNQEISLKCWNGCTKILRITLRNVKCMH